MAVTNIVKIQNSLLHVSPDWGNLNVGMYVQLTKILHDIVSFTFTMRSTILEDDFTKVATKSFASASTSQNLYFSHFWLRSPLS